MHLSYRISRGHAHHLLYIIIIVKYSRLNGYHLCKRRGGAMQWIGRGKKNQRFCTVTLHHVYIPDIVENRSCRVSIYIMIKNKINIIYLYTISQLHNLKRVRVQHSPLRNTYGTIGPEDFGYPSARYPAR